MEFDKKIIWFINITRWQKTDYIRPHEYTMRDWNPRIGEDFDNLVRLIDEIGVDKEFRIFGTVKTFRYLEIKGYEYWVMREMKAVHKSFIKIIIINRRKL